MGKKRIITTEEKVGDVNKKAPKDNIKNVADGASKDITKNASKDNSTKDSDMSKTSSKSVTKSVEKSSPKKDGEKSDSTTKQSLSRKRLDVGVLHVQSTYNNTKVLLTDTLGGAVMWSSSGSLGFKGAKKGTPFAAAKVGETLAVKAQALGLKEISVVVKGVGSGRESAIRGFISKGVTISSIKDSTPVPHNGPQPKKPRRV